MIDNATRKPLTPKDCDLTDFHYIPIDVRRLLNSETWILGNDLERAASMCLWLESWHQVPAASIPSNDKMLAHLSRAGNSWKKAKDHVLRGWVDGGDGRLYHPVVAEKALEAWIEKLANAISGKAGNSKRWSVEIDSSDLNAKLVDAVERLKSLAPHSKSLKKKVVNVIGKLSPPDTKTPPKIIAPRSQPDENTQQKIIAPRSQPESCTNHHPIAIERERERERDIKETNVSLPPYPQNLDLTAWERWVSYRRQIGKPLKPASIAAAQQALAKHGATQAAVVEQSIANGWQGLFELKTPTKQAVSERQSREEKLREVEKLLGFSSDFEGDVTVIDSPEDQDPSEQNPRRLTT